MRMHGIMRRTCGAAVRRVVVWAAKSVDIVKYQTIVAAFCQKQCGCIHECASVEVQLGRLLENQNACTCEQADQHFVHAHFVEPKPT